MSALLLDCDGVLADTESNGHRPAFNQTFAEFGLPVHWDEQEYGRKLAIGGGKERLRSLLTPGFVREAGLPNDPDVLDAKVGEWHRRKTELYGELVRAGGLPPRPGVRRLIDRALNEGWTVAVASTSAPESVRAVLETVAPDRAGEIPIFAGDVVSAKKPAPDVYLLALARLRLDPRDALAIEDSRNGLCSAVGAGLRCLVTVSGYTREEDFSESVLAVSDLGDPGSPPISVISGRAPDGLGEWLELDDLRALLATTSEVARGD